MRVHIIALVLSSLALTSSAHALANEDKWVEGTWVAPSRFGQFISHISIKDCGNGTPCGTLVWLAPRSPAPRTDRLNPDALSKSRTLIGTPILYGFTKRGSGWSAGHLYNPEDGKTFSSALARGQDGQLLVTGCLGPLCQTKAWKRANHD
jgi:uncharacterized protein (DUF2147 family)